MPSNSNTAAAAAAAAAAPAAAKPTIKIVVVGDGGAGKTCLLSTFACGRFPTEYVPTVFDNFESSATIGGRCVQLSLWDTAGQEDYDQLRPLSYSGADAFIICFSVASRPSFVNACSKWWPEIRRHSAKAPIVLAGTKADLRDDPDCQRHMRRHGTALVLLQEAKRAAANVGAVAYVDTSALRFDRVSDAFEAAVRAVLWPEAAMLKRKRGRRVCSVQ